VVRSTGSASAEAPEDTARRGARPQSQKEESITQRHKAAGPQRKNLTQSHKGTALQRKKASHKAKKPQSHSATKKKNPSFLTGP
jgi:hypothetical protein